MVAASPRCLPALLVLLFFVSAANFAQAAGDKAKVSDGLFVDLDAAKLSAGAITNWRNTGTLGGELSPLDKSPRVVDLAGRRAVSFEGGGPLKASFAVPDELCNGNPFTVAVWAYSAMPGAREVLAGWGVRPNGAADFCYGLGNDGAFGGSDRPLRYPKIPTAGAWQHIAWSFDGKQLSVYVQGALKVQQQEKLAVKAGGPLLLGAALDNSGKKPTFPFHGALAGVKVWSRALTERELRNSAGWTAAYDPAPADGSTANTDQLKFSWKPGTAGVASYDIRVAGTVEKLTHLAGEKVASAEFTSPALTPGQTIYWRVDQLDAQSKRIGATGDVWKFSTDGGPSTSPNPRHRVAGVKSDLAELRWTPGRFATSQTLYFGTDEAAVREGKVDPHQLEGKAKSFAMPAKLDFGKTYFWRVEQDNGKYPKVAGDVWAFRTVDKHVKDDVTFFVTSDCHYGLGNNDELNRKVIDEMNWLPGAELPKAVGGGVVPTPRGVVLNGDLLDKGFETATAPHAWAAFEKDYGLIGNDGRLGYPLYEGFGNHDGMTGPSYSRAGIKERNQKRVGLTMISPNGFHYSWDWDNVHLTQLNLFPGTDSADCITGPANHHPEDSLGFLKADLKKNVGDSGKIVIVFCHYCYSGGMADWWNERAKDRFREVLTGYRVVLIHGHSHGAYVYNWKDLRAISDGAAARPDGQTGDFMMVRIVDGELRVAQRKLDAWGLTLRERLPSALKARPEEPATTTPVKE